MSKKALENYFAQLSGETGSLWLEVVYWACVGSFGRWPRATIGLAEPHFVVIQGFCTYSLGA